LLVKTDSIRDDRWRLTEWVSWDQKNLLPEWENSHAEL